MIANYKSLMIIILILLIFFIINLNFKYNYILPGNNDFNLFKNYYDIKELIHTYTYNNELKNINIQIPTYISPRKDVPILNTYKLIKNEVIFDDYCFVIYYLDSYKCKIIIRRLDSYKLNYNFSIKIYDVDNINYDIINFNSYNELANEIIIEYQSNIKLEKVIYEETKIPKVIIQTGNSNIINLAQYNAALTFIDLNPEFTYIYFDDLNRTNFLIKHFDKSVLNAYNNIKPLTYKADLFRYCYLYIKGGCYFDNKMINRIPIRDVINIDDNIILSKENGEKYTNGVLLSIKNNIIFKKCIDECVYNINNRLYCKNSWDITGPSLLFRQVPNYNSKLISDFRFINIKLRHKNLIKIKKSNKIFCNISYYQYYTKYIDSNYYVLLWLMKKVYS